MEKKLVIVNHSQLTTLTSCEKSHVLSVAQLVVSILYKIVGHYIIKTT